MARFALIGGKSNREVVSNKIEKHLVGLVPKDKPTILYCPYASLNDIDKSINKFYRLVKDIDCNIINMTFDNVDEFELLLKKADILYIGGGHCDELVKFFNEHKLTEVLAKHISSDIIFAGSSAGAMLYTVASMGDRHVYLDNFHYHNYKMVNCLGFLNITICPHYQNDDLVVYNDELRKYPYDAFGVEEDTMVVIEDNKYYVVKEDSNRSVYYFDKDKEYLMIPLYEGVCYEKDSSFRSWGYI